MCIPMFAALGTALTASTASAATVGTLAAASIGASAISAIGQYQQLKSQKQMAQYNADNARFAAQAELERGNEEAMQLGRKGRQLRGDQVAAMGARGLSLTSGSPLDVLSDTDYLTAVDQYQARKNSMQNAHQIGAQAAGYDAQASSIRPGQTAGMTFLGSVAQVAAQWYGRGSPSGAKSTDFHTSYVNAVRATRG